MPKQLCLICLALCCAILAACSQAQNYHEVVVPYLQDGKWGLCTTNNVRITAPIYSGIDLHTLTAPLVHAHKEGKYGLVDRSGKEVVACEYDDIRPLHPGYYQLEQGTIRTLVDATGKVLLGPDEPWFIIGQEGQLITIADNAPSKVWALPLKQVAEYPKIKTIQKTKDLYEVSDGHQKFGVLHRSGKLILPIQYDRVELLRSDPATDTWDLLLTHKGDLRGLYTVEGQQIYPDSANSISIALKGVCWVKQGGKNRLITTDGELLTGEEHNYLTMLKDNETGIKYFSTRASYYDTLGQKKKLEEISPAAFRRSELHQFFKNNFWKSNFLGGFWHAATKQGKWALYYNKEQVIGEKFDEIGRILWEEGQDIIFTAKYNGKWSLFDRGGEPLGGFSCDNFFENQPGMVTKWDAEKAVFELDGKQGLVAVKTGEVLLPPVYDELVLRPHDHATVVMYKDKKSGILNKAYQEVLPVNFSLIQYLDGVFICHISYAEIALYDINGKRIDPSKSYTKVLNWGRDKYWLTAKDNTRDLVDQQGNLVFQELTNPLILHYTKPDPDGPEPFKPHELLYAQKEGHYGLWRPDGTEILPPEFDKINLIYQDQYFLVEKDGKEYVTDTKGTVYGL